jgi:hypothetical protein
MRPSPPFSADPRVRLHSSIPRHKRQTGPLHRLWLRDPSQLSPVVDLANYLILSWGSEEVAGAEGQPPWHSGFDYLRTNFGRGGKRQAIGDLWSGWSGAGDNSHRGVNRSGTAGRRLEDNYRARRAGLVGRCSRPTSLHGGASWARVPT